jgi:hypothetical protein
LFFRLAVTSGLVAVSLLGGPWCDASEELEAQPTQTSIVGLPISKFPARTQPVSRRSRWGIDQQIQLVFQLINNTPHAWHEIAADGGCSCLKVSLGTIPKAGVGPGESLLVKAAYAQPEDPGITARTIRFDIDQQLVSVPIMVSWDPPLKLEMVRQVKPNVWRLAGPVLDSVQLASVDSLQNDITVESFDVRDRRFSIDVAATVKVATYCSLRCRVFSSASPSQDGDSAAEIEQVLQISLQSTEPRSIPSRLVCMLDGQGILSGQTRILFPRVRQKERPNLKRCTLIDDDGDRHPLAAQDEGLGKIALKLNFRSESPISADSLNTDSKIEFLFDDGSIVRCLFQLSQE